jgi:S-disulfanyl-L-cysteine oxidoreductase SoxD
MTILRTIVAVTLPALVAGPLAAQSGPPPADQAGRGQAVFQRVCAACHATVQFTSPGFRSGWNGRTVFELYEQIRTTMPQDNPGRLRREQYADITAYLLKLNGQPPAELTTDSTALSSIQIQLATDSRSP